MNLSTRALRKTYYPSNLYSVFKIRNDKTYLITIIIIKRGTRSPKNEQQKRPIWKSESIKFLNSYLIEYRSLFQIFKASFAFALLLFFQSYRSVYHQSCQIPQFLPPLIILAEQKSISYHVLWQVFINVLFLSLCLGTLNEKYVSVVAFFLIVVCFIVIESPCFTFSSYYVISVATETISFTWFTYFCGACNKRKSEVWWLMSVKYDISGVKHL